jgi:hypothetical protein
MEVMFDEAGGDVHGLKRVARGLPVGLGLGALQPHYNLLFQPLYFLLVVYLIRIPRLP